MEALEGGAGGVVSNHDDFIVHLKIMFNEHANQFPPEMMVFLTDLESMIISIVDVMEVQGAVYPNINAVVSPLAQ